MAVRLTTVKTENIYLKNTGCSIKLFEDTILVLYNEQLYSLF